MLKRILDFLWRPCPSGLPHRVRWGTVKNWLGKEYCWHQDCMRANFAECERVVCACGSAAGVEENLRSAIRTINAMLPPSQRNAGVASGSQAFGGTRNEGISNEPTDF